MEVFLRSNLNLPVYSSFNQANVGGMVNHGGTHLQPFLYTRCMRPHMKRVVCSAILRKLFRDSSLIRKTRYRLTTRNN